MSMDATTVVSPPDGCHYWAFISYSQRDRRWADWLLPAIETYRFPRGLVGRQTGAVTIPQRLFPVFRDQDELPSAGDLNRKIQQGLENSYALIVICSPNAAASRWVNEEVRLFKTMGRADRIFPLIVDGEPNAAERLMSDSTECFPPALRFIVTADGTLTADRAEPLAADAREGRGGRRNAFFRLLAGIAGIGFDDLRRREDVRARHRLLVRAAAAVAAALIAGAFYLGLADGNVGVPGGAAIRDRIDRHGLSVLRRIPSREAVLEKAVASRAKLRQGILALAATLTLNPADYKVGVWDVGQAVSAVYRDPDASQRDLDVMVPLFDQVFRDDMMLMIDGKPAGWLDSPTLPRAESSIWTTLALSETLGRAAHALSATTRDKLTGYLDVAQGIADGFRPLPDGGWNIAREEKAETHFIYTTALALHVLLELNANGHCWHGDCARMREMIRTTYDWLVDAFVADEAVRGWRRQIDDDKPPDLDLSLYAYGAIARAAVDLGFVVPETIKTAALEQLISLARRPYYPSQADTEHWTRFADDRGRRQMVNQPTRLFWYPWALEALVQWLRYAGHAQLRPESIRGLERSLGHLVIDLSGAMIGETSRAPIFVRAEALYGLGGVR